MKRLALLAAVLLTSLSVRASTVRWSSQSWIVTSTVALQGNASNLWAFQNADANTSVYIDKLEVSIASSSANGAPVNFWLLASTQTLESSTSTVNGASYTYSPTTPLTSPSWAVAAYTIPLSIQPSTSQPSVPLLEQPLPLARPLALNSATSATTLTSDAYTDFAPFAEGAAAPLKLAKGQNRAIILQQEQVGTTNLNGAGFGQIMVRLLYHVDNQ